MTEDKISSMKGISAENIQSERQSKENNNTKFIKSTIKRIL